MLQRDGRLKMTLALPVKKANDTTQMRAQHMMDMFQKKPGEIPDKALKPGDNFFTQKRAHDHTHEGQMISMVNGKISPLNWWVFRMERPISTRFRMWAWDGKVHGTNATVKAYPEQANWFTASKDNFPLSKEGTVNLTIKANSSFTQRGCNYRLRAVIPDVIKLRITPPSINSWSSCRWLLRPGLLFSRRFDEIAIPSVSLLRRFHRADWLLFLMFCRCFPYRPQSRRIYHNMAPPPVAGYYFQHVPVLPLPASICLKWYARSP